MNLAVTVILEEPVAESPFVHCVDLGIVERPAPLVDGGHTDESRGPANSFPYGPVGQ
jgi:hypothetical protein